MARKNVIHVRLSDDEKKQLEKLAEQEARSSMDTIRWLIRLAAKQQQKAGAQ